jgi:hypothetical protein
MSEPLSFSERLRAWRQRTEARAAALPVAAESDNVLPFRRDFDSGLEDEPRGAVPWLDCLRAEPWVPTVED